MNTTQRIKSLAIGLATVAAMGAAVAQSNPPTNSNVNPATGAGQQNSQGTPMGATGTPTSDASTTPMGARSNTYGNNSNMDSTNRNAMGAPAARADRN